MTNILDPAIWVVNGLLVILFFLLDHLATIFLMVMAGAFILLTPAPQRPWAVGAGVLASAASILAPPPVPVFLTIVALASAAALYLEHYNRPAALWNTIRSVSLYSLAGLGYALWRNLHVADWIQQDAMMAQGATYINALIGIAMYVFPLGIVVMLAQSVLAHPPTTRPETMLNQIRTRGKDR